MYKECLNRKNLYPPLYEVFIQGDFIVNHTSRKSSNEPVDHDLEVYKTQEVQLLSMLHRFWAITDTKIAPQELFNRGKNNI